MNVLVIDDQPVYGEGLTNILRQKFPRFRVKCLGQADSVLNAANDFLSSIDLIVLGVNAPHSGSAKLLEKSLDWLTKQTVIVLSTTYDYQQVKKILELGVSGVIPKDYSTDEMVNAITECCSGHVHIPTATQEQINQVSLMTSNRDAVAKSLHITNRQLQVLTLMDERLTNDEIAEKLFVSKATVKSHINMIYSALHVKSRKICIERAYELGILFCID